MRVESLEDAESEQAIPARLVAQRAGSGMAVAIALAVLLLSLVIDLTPRFHFGDSADFLLTRWHGYITNDRSWTYGLAIGWLLRTTRQLASVAAVQILLSWVAFSTFAAAVVRSTYAGWRTAIVILLLGCFEPLGFYWSRSFMSDSAAQSAFVLLCAILLFRFGLAIRFSLVLAAGFALISLRVVYFPALAAALGATVLWRLWRILRAEGNGRLARIASNGALRNWVGALAAILLANLAYARENTDMTQGRVLTTNIDDMAFLSGALSPLMTNELDKVPLTARERASLYPLTYENRVGNTFSPNGLVQSIKHHYATAEAARPVLRRLVVDAIRDHPLAFAELVLRQWADYLDPVLVMRHARAGDLSGAVPVSRTDTRVVMPGYIVDALNRWKVSPPPQRDMPTRPSPALRYLEFAGGAWSLVLSWYATFSLLFIFAVPRERRSAFLIFAGSFAFLYMAEIAVGANQIVTRYLLPLSAPLLYTMIVLFGPGEQRR